MRSAWVPLAIVVPLLAGCVVLEEPEDAQAPDPGDGPEPLPVPQGWTAAEPDPATPGLTLIGMLGVDGRRSFANASASNEGNETLFVASGPCGSPWGFTVLDAARQVVPRQPDRAMACPPPTNETFPPGARLGMGQGWDGDVWRPDANGGSYGPAPPGDYVWQISFAAEPSRLTLEFPFHLDADTTRPHPARPTLPDGRAINSDGLTMEAELFGTNRSWTLRAVFGNDGPNDAWVVPGCPHLFDAGMLRDGEPVPHEVPSGCAGVWRVIHLPPGWWLEQTLSWNETVVTWQGGDRYGYRHDPARPGTYTWTVDADVMVGDPHTGTRRTLPLAFDFVIP